jgi:hypothetical protein
MSEHKHAHPQPDAEPKTTKRYVAVGRTVHYCSHGSPVLPDGSQHYKPECRAAIITALSQDADSGETGPKVSLAVLNPTGLFFQENLGHSDDHTGGSWHWPEMIGPESAESLMDVVANTYG